VTVQTIPETEMTTRLATDINIIVDWLRADNFTSKQLTAVRKTALSNIKAVKNICIAVLFSMSIKDPIVLQVPNISDVGEVLLC